MMTLQDIFSIWPSDRAMAEELSEKTDTVKHWRLRGRIPSDVWPKIIEKAARRETLVTASQLLDLHAGARRKVNTQSVNSS